MLRNPKAQMAVVLAVGLLAGYAASGSSSCSRRRTPGRRAKSSLSPVPHSHSGESGDGAQPTGPPACCCARRRQQGRRLPRGAQQRGPAEVCRVRQEAEHPRHLGRRHRLLERQRLQPWRDGLPHAQHRPHRQERGDLHRLLRPAVLHGWPGGFHYRPEPLPHRPAQGRPAGCQGGTVGQATPTWPICSRRWATSAASSARTTWALPQRHAADRHALPGVLRQPLPPQRRRGAREPGLLPRTPSSARGMLGEVDMPETEW